MTVYKRVARKVNHGSCATVKTLSILHHCRICGGWSLAVLELQKAVFCKKSKRSEIEFGHKRSHLKKMPICCAERSPPLRYSVTVPHESRYERFGCYVIEPDAHVFQRVPVPIQQTHKPNAENYPYRKHLKAKVYHVGVHGPFGLILWPLTLCFPVVWSRSHSELKFSIMLSAGSSFYL